MICPRCGNEQPVAPECGKCGVIFERMHTLGRLRPVKPLPPTVTLPVQSPVHPVGQAAFRTARALLVLRPATHKQRHIFFVQLGRMLQSGVPIDEALARIGDVVGRSPMERAARAMARDVQEGLSLSGAMDRQDAVFDEVERAVVAALEHTGDLPRAATRLAARVEEARIQAGILRGAVAYPAFLITTSILSGPVALAVTQGPGAYLAALAWPMTLWLLFLAFGLRILPAWLSRPHVRTGLLDVLAGLPLTGWMLVNRRYASLFDVLAQTLDAGILLPRALELASRATAETRMIEAGRLVALALEKGATLAAASDGLPGLDPASKATVAAGERTGHLPETFAELAKERQAAWQQQLRLAVRVLGAAMTLAAMLYVGWTVVAQMQQSAGNPLAGLPASDVRELERALGKDLFK